MSATLALQGFGLDPDDAIADFHQRATRHVEQGWTEPETIHVTMGSNPYANFPVYGYVADGLLTK